MRSATIRVAELGGTEFRRADIRLQTQSKPLVLPLPTTAHPTGPEKLVSLTAEKLDVTTLAIVYVVAGPLTENRIIQVLPNVEGWPRNVDIVALTGTYRPAYALNDMWAAVPGIAYLLRTQENFTGSFWGITISSGVGGKLWDGERIASDAEIGHITLNYRQNARVCGCGGRGHAEAIISGNRMKERVVCEIEEGRRWGNATEYQALWERMQKGEHPCALLDEAYLAHTPWATALYHQWAKLTGIFFSNLMHIAPAKRIVLKGTFGINAIRLPGIKDIMMNEMAERAVSPEWVFKDIRPSPDPEKDALLGGGLFAIERLSADLEKLTR